MSLTDVSGVRVGHWTDSEAATGCTVIIPPSPNVCAVEIRGAAPGSRETALLAPGMRVEEISALLFTGGSAYGLAAADGVMAAAEAEGRGHPTPWGPVPIVPAAVIFDLGVGDFGRRPDAAAGRAAYESASGDPVVSGRYGAGAGATVAKLRGPDGVRPGGLGSAAVVVAGVTVAALTVVNAVGDVFTLDGEALTGGTTGGGAWAAHTPVTNTTLVCVVTDAGLSRAELMRVCVRSQDALAAVIRPGHTRYDGDAAFAISCGSIQGDVDQISEAAFEVTARAIEAAIRSSAGAEGLT